MTGVDPVWLSVAGQELPSVDTWAETIRRLNQITGGDPERDHSEADALVLDALPEPVLEAYERVIGRNRGRWWYA